MKAYVLHDINNFKLEEVPTPGPSENEVLVAVKAAGICGSDIPRVYKTGTYSYPLIPGHEFSGVVTAVGNSVDAKWQGKRVGIFPLIPCKKCGPCLKISTKCAVATAILAPVVMVGLRSIFLCLWTTWWSFRRTFLLKRQLC